MRLASVSNSGALIETLAPSRSLARNVVLVLGGATLTALAAQIQVPWQPVPWTLQTLAVFLCALALGSRLGALSQVAYLSAGLMGAPVFAQGKAGLPALLGPTGGYLIAFVGAAYLLGLVADRGWDRKVWALALGMLVANALILVLGAGWLSVAIGFDKAVQVGVLPFVAGDVLKAVVAVVALPSAWKLVELLGPKD